MADLNFQGRQKALPIDDLAEADALPTLRTRCWVILGLLTFGIATYAAIAWLIKCVVDAVIAVGWPV